MADMSRSQDHGRAGSRLADGVFVAVRSGTFCGVPYEPGEEVDVSTLPDHKISQLLDQRRLRPGRGSQG